MTTKEHAVEVISKSSIVGMALKYYVSKRSDAQIFDSYISNLADALISAGLIKEELDEEKVSEAVKEGHQQYIKAGMHGEWNLRMFITEAICSKFSKPEIRLPKNPSIPPRGDRGD